MNLRMGLYRLAALHRLDAGGVEALERCAGLDQEPPEVQQAAFRAAAALAAALVGLGLVFWVAANWETLGRFGRFALLQSVVVVMALGAAWRPAARAPLALLAFIATGALFAYFGQTYQTGADPWQLFALWALLALPLVLAVRSDLLWAPWALVAVTAVSLWVHAHTAHRWRVETEDLTPQLVGWSLALLLAAALGPGLQRFTGAGPWARRTAVTLAVTMISLTAAVGLFGRTVAPQYPLGLLLLAGGAAFFASRRGFEVYALSAVALGLDSLLVAGLARWLFDDRSGGEPIGQLLIIGLAAAGLLAASVQLVLRVARLRAQEGVV